MIEELLSGAQSAVFDDNLERVVMELAIACEITVKNAFLQALTAKKTRAGKAYEYLDDKGRLNVPINDMIHGMAKQVFGKSFNDAEKDHYKNIDLLFQCRNKVVHKYKLTYKESGVEHAVDEKVLAEWWKSVLILLDWIKANTPA